MSWRNNTMEKERLEFVNKVLDSEEEKPFRTICEEYNISRKTGYKWYYRFLIQGQEGLTDHSRTRLTQSKKISETLENEIVAIRNQFPFWGPKKIHAELLSRGIIPPSQASIGNILKKHQLSKPRCYRRHVAQTAPLAYCKNTNDVWVYDFKGHFKTGDGKTCEPLTITDGHSRYLLKCAHMPRKRGIDVWKILEEAFFEYGLPLRIRSDNGPPFATTGIGRLSPLAIKIIKAGVTPEWIRPGCPQDNGRHERLHLTLKNETALPPALTLALQIEKMKQFKDYYNHQRHHEALDLKTPASIYQKSPRVWNGHLRSPEYSAEYEIRKVGKSGSITWRNTNFFISESLCKEYIGLREETVGIMSVYYGPILLGKINLDKGFKKI